MHRRIGGQDSGRAAERIDSLAKWNLGAANGEAFVIVQAR